MTKSLQEVSACLAGVSMIVLSRVLAFVALSLLVQPQLLLGLRFASHNRSDVNFY
jgi:hypothetical protein